jgi:hypothetical protein
MEETVRNKTVRNIDLAKNEVELQIKRLETKLEETRSAAVHQRGPVTDALMVVIPMMEDQLALLREVLKLIGS